MKLFLNTASPYARLIRVLLAETGLDSETTLTYVDPWASPPDLLAANPAGKIPALVLDDGTALIESACIADYLVRESGQTSLRLPAKRRAAARLRALGLGRAAIDCAFGAVVQQRYAPGSPLADRWLSALPRIAAALEPLVAGNEPAAPDQADLTLAVAFDYVGFRLPEIPWQATAPMLARRIDFLRDRPSLQSTAPS